MKKLTYILLLSLLTTISCTDNQSKNSYDYQLGTEVSEEVSFSRTSNLKTKDNINTANTSTNISIEQKLIKNGSVSFESYNLEKTKQSIKEAVKNYNAYVASENSYNSDYRLTNTITVRIPANNFDSFLEDISKGVERFESKNISVRDVTEQFLDTEARLNTKKKLEVRYLDLLEKAKTVREILEVEKQLAKVRSEIESVEGRLRYLKNQVSYSTLTVTYFKETSNSPSFIRSIKESFKNGIQNIASFLLITISIWPFILMAIVLLILFKRWKKNRKS